MPESESRRHFDHSRMVLLNLPAHGGRGGGPGRAPFIVLTSEAVLRERPELDAFRTEQKPGYSVWGGNDPPPVYLSLPDVETLHRLVGNPNPPSDSEGAFDAGIFDEAVFDTGRTLEIDDATSVSKLSHVELRASSGTAAGAGGAAAVSEVERFSPERADEVRQLIRSADWTGIERRMASAPDAAEQVAKIVVELDRAVERCGLTNFEQQRAKALTGALLKLVSSPQPEWQLIVQILNSPVFTALWRIKDVGVLLVALGTILVAGG